MPRIDFARLPDAGRLWVFPVSRPLGTDELRRTADVVDEFLEQWKAHGVPLRCAREIEEGRFVLVGVDEDAEAPSGCSIDALVNRLRALGQEIGATFIEHGPVWYREGDEIRAVSRAEFKTMADDGRVTPRTHVFDTSLTRVGELREGALEKPARESWHGRAFFGLAPASGSGGA